jgi:hypothetical protein
MGNEQALMRVLALAKEFDATLIDLPSSSIASDPVLDVTVTSVDGRRTVYRLVLTAWDREVTAREQTPDKLPPFCPQLHINGDGTFCLGWSGTTLLEVEDEESARLWWARLHGYLRMQQRARRLGRWPDREWAHGDAARHQHEAEVAAVHLGQDFVQDLEGKKFEAAWCRWDHPVHGRMLQVFRDGTPIYKVSERHQRVLNSRQACICANGDIKRHKRLRSCGGHMKVAFDFAVALRNWVSAEDQFWKALAKTNRTCCGRASDCRLRAEPLSQLEAKE